MKRVPVFITLLFFFLSYPAFNTYPEETKQRKLEGIEFLTGFGWGRLRAKENYNLHPLLVDFDFNLKPLINKLNLFPAQIIQFQVEPFFCLVSQPDTNIESGASFLFKLGLLPEGRKFQPFVKAGARLDS